MPEQCHGLMRVPCKGAAPLLKRVLALDRHQCGKSPPTYKCSNTCCALTLMRCRRAVAVQGLCQHMAGPPELYLCCKTWEPPITCYYATGTDQMADVCDEVNISSALLHSANAVYCPKSTYTAPNAQGTLKGNCHILGHSPVHAAEPKGPILTLHG